ncbi:type II toxin-antitoxin system Phd/YefM family antitoxin [Desulfoscipio gibsoniae]|uniref:Antitoxin n=1 Tax=Desulfoscipio gibsoniae DSM 7213 TaxID=767817 RepID=R4KKE9_9FIRM|nr:type II toxin-antitoxin system Phd/YefM family antitoxin [Desulfoscipio gibsoniae]AGL00106.1 antitoxin of toxin-antitoxin stability system [Desulfoscipio gibsoniae DSM 7213]
MHIKPSTTIRQNYNAFSKFCHELDEPVVLTRNGEADLVVMSHAAFRRMEARIKFNPSYWLQKSRLLKVNN